MIGFLMMSRKIDGDFHIAFTAGVEVIPANASEHCPDN